MPMIKRYKLYFVICTIYTLLGLLLGGCAPPGGQPAAPTPEPTLTPMIEDPPLPKAPTETPAAGFTPSPAVITGTATVESVEVILLESMPVQVNVVAKGYLPDACTEIGQIDQVRQGDSFVITITTTRPADAACAEVIQPFEETIPLQVEGLQAGTYTVTVNGVSSTFELRAENTQP